MIVCSTNCTLFTSFLCRFLCCQFFDKLLCFAFCSALPIKPCCHRENDAYQIGYQVFNRVLCDIHNLDRPALQCNYVELILSLQDSPFPPELTIFREAGKMLLTGITGRSRLWHSLGVGTSESRSRSRSSAWTSPSTAAFSSSLKGIS